MSFWDIVWFILITYAFVAYLMVMFALITDVFRDPDSSGFTKAAWIAGFIFLPLISAIAYLASQGKSMSERQLESAQRAQQQQVAFSSNGSGRTPSDQITQAQTLMNDGVISRSEFDRIKEKALA